MSGRAGVLRGAVLAALFVLGGCDRPRPGEPPRQVLLITFENVRADHCSALQYPRPTTFVEVGEDEPRAHDLDLIAETGVAFAKAFAPSGDPWVSLAALHTGRTPITGASLPADIATLAEQFAAADFETAAFIMASVPITGTGLERGFAHFEEHAEPVDLLRGVARWLYQVRDEEAPHLIWLHVGEAAWPWEWSRLPGSRGGLDFARLFADPAQTAPAKTDLEHLLALQRGDVSASPEERTALVAAYDGQVTRANLVMREFLEYYKHLWSETLVVVASANGMELGERGGWGAAGTVHDEGLHVPLLLRHPGSLTGRRIVAEVVELADVAPTVLEWFELDRPPHFTGRSLLPLVDSYVERPFARRPAEAWGTGGTRSARDERWRLVLDADGTARLFDLDADPTALHDVAAAHPAALERLRAFLAADRQP